MLICKMPTSKTRYTFDRFSLDVERCVVQKDGRDIALRPQSFDVLRYLVENAGRPVPSAELLDALWRGRVVTEDSVRKCIADLRDKLGDGDATLLRTMPRRGYLIDVPVGRSDAADPTSAHAARRSATRRAAAVLLTLIAAASAIVYLSRELPDAAPVATRELPADSVAVLRFADLSPEGDQAWLADGIAEEILHRLAQSDGLRVIARTSSFAADGLSVDNVAALLDVRYVLEGSVRRDGDELRVTAQLIDATTNAHVWSNIYDRQLESLFEVQETIAGAIARAMNVSLADDPFGPPDVRAQEPYLLGQHYLRRRKDGDLLLARDHFEQAVAVDPSHARAWTGIAVLANIAVGRGTWDRRGRISAADAPAVMKHAVGQALRYGPTLAEANMVAATYFTNVEPDPARAWQHIETAYAIEPRQNRVQAALYTLYLHYGRLPEAIDILQEIVLRDPLNATERLNLGGLLMYAGRANEAVAEFARVAEVRGVAFNGDPHVKSLILANRLEEADAAAATLPEGPERHAARALLYHRLGRAADSDAALRALEASATCSTHWLKVAEVYAARGDAASSMRWLDRALAEPRCLPGLTEEDAYREIYYSPILATLSDAPLWSARRARAKEGMIGKYAALEPHFNAFVRKLPDQRPDAGSTARRADELDLD